MDTTKRTIDRRLVLATMIVGTFAAAISQSMLTAVLPAIMQEFDIDAVSGQMLTTCYIFTMGLVAALSAYLIKRFNVRHLFWGSIGLFIIGCAVDYFAQNYAMLLAARIIEACGAGVLMPLMQVVMLDIYPKEQYGRALGLAGLVFGFVPVLGPMLSGVITDFIGWRYIFLILGCVALLSLFASLFTIQDVGYHKKQALDVPSVLLYSVGLVFLMGGITYLEQAGFSWESALPGLVGLVLLAVFVVRQLRIDHPYLEVALFKNKEYTIGTILLMLAQVVMISSAVQVPLYIQDIHGLTAVQSALIVLPGALCLPVLSPITGRIYDKIGGRGVALLGFTLLGVATVAFMFFSPTTPTWLIVAMHMLRMSGIAFALMPMTAYSMADLAAPDIPQGTAIQNSARQIVGSIGSSVMIAIATAFSGSTTAESGMDMTGFSVSMGCQVALLVVAFVVALIFVKKHVSKKTEAPESEPGSEQGEAAKNPDLRKA